MNISGKISLTNNLKRNSPDLGLGFCLIACGGTTYLLSKVTTFKLSHPLKLERL